MRVKNVAERLEVSATTVYALVSSGELRHYRVGVGRGQIRFSEEHLADYLASCEVRPTPVIPPKPRPQLVKSRFFHRD